MTSYPTYPPPAVTYQNPIQSPQFFHPQYGLHMLGYLPVQLPKPHPKHHRLPPGDLSSVTPQIASQAVQRLLSTQLRAVGYDSAQPQALQRLELEVIAFVTMLYERAHEYSNLANRAGPIATDLLHASAECGLRTKDLHKLGAKSSKKRKRESMELSGTLIPPASRSPSPELLHSDDEGTLPVIPATLRTLPPNFPALPPKHTYLRTPVTPPKKAALPSLEKKLKTAGLVQESLKNLLLATEDNIGQEDGELLGHLVNWEASTYPRKRWKVVDT